MKNDLDKDLSKSKTILFDADRKEEKFIKLAKWASGGWFINFCILFGESGIEEVIIEVALLEAASMFNGLMVIWRRDEYDINWGDFRSFPNIYLRGC